MLYQESIIRNLPCFSPPGIRVTLRRLGRNKVQFRIESANRSFLLQTDRPDIYSFIENTNQMRAFFALAHRRCIAA
jgi:hypothetical protein